MMSNVTVDMKSKNSAFVYLKFLGYLFIMVYILWSSKEIARLSNDVYILRHTVKGLQSEAYGPKKVVPSDIENNQDENLYDTVHHIHKRSSKDLEKRTCKKEKRYLKKCRRKLRKLTASSQNRGHTQAAHVSLDFKINSTMSRRLATTMDNCFSEYGGIVCYSNKTYDSGIKARNSGNKRVFGIPWKLLTTPNLSPLQLTENNGEFKVKYDGLYLVYLNIMFIPAQPEERVGIFLDEKRIMTCQDGLTLERGVVVNRNRYNLTEKTCSTLGVFIVNKHQTLSIRIETQKTQVLLWGVANNFGVVLLHKK